MQTNFGINIRTGNITDIITSLLKNKKHQKELTQSSVFALSLILHSTKYTVTWHKIPLLCVSSYPIYTPAILASALHSLLYYLYFIFFLGASELPELPSLICC